ncbi:MAG: hypothetical protein JSS35_01330 [Proteobacteria bacterium]|nr:hypothetical protein [Pseudomonadota bacterium]
MTAVTFFRPVAARPDRGWLALLAFVRPFVLLAALAFFAGFGGYLILGPPQVLTASQPAALPSADAATPASDDGVAPDWNPPKRI